MTTAHKITLSPARAHVQISLGGTTLAESDRAVLLAEGSLPARYYLPREDVRTDLLSPTDTHSTCPFKGQASYWSAEVDGQVHEDIVWSYESPIPEVEGIAGLMCFYAERVDQTVGEQAPAL